MSIEVTQDTFYKIFENEPTRVEKKETHEIHHYECGDIGQRGRKIWNYVSSKVHQYYLIDINA